MPTPLILSVGTAVPTKSFSQADLMRLLSVSEPERRRFFLHKHVETRRLDLPDPDPGSGLIHPETTGQLLARFSATATKLGREAVERALAGCGVGQEDIQGIVCVTSTGFLVPGLSALMIRSMGLNTAIQRMDIVGMGCNAGLNGLNAAVSWAKANPEKKILLLCAEICSAIYSVDDSVNSALVNSLFGDGVAAVLIGSSPEKAARFSPLKVLGFESRLIPEHFDALRFDWDDERHRFRFHVGRATPKVLAAFAGEPVENLLQRFGINRRDVKHWILHSGGAAILEGIEEQLGLPRSELRHTYSVLRELGNLSSGSYLFSLQRLQEEGGIQPGDYGLFMTMGPGLTVETALVQWGA